MPDRRQPHPYVPPDRIIGEEERRLITGYSRQSWWRLERQGAVPRRIQLGANKVGWLESELLAWVRSKAELRDGAVHGSGSCSRPTSW
jgi:prophage regulatory protein